MSCSFAASVTSVAASGATMIVDGLLLLRGDRLEVVGDAAQQALDIARHDLHGLLPGIEPRQPQQILHQPLHARRMPVNDVEKLLARLGVVGIVEQRFRVALDRGQRRAQFVRDVGDEIAPT